MPAEDSREPPGDPTRGRSVRRPARTGGRTGAARARAGPGAAPGARPAYTLRQARRATHAEGAGDTGLSRLIELHAFNAAGDAAVAISLAGTLFFQVPTDQARGQVALFLGLTMLPFAVVAPLIGPFLDRFSHGRRWAIGVDDGAPRVPVLGARRTPSRRRLAWRCSPRRSAAWSRPRRTASPGPPPSPGCCRPS